MMATQDEVNAACAVIAARGERPTVERVRTELGGGSPNSLTPQVRAWKDTQRAAPASGAVQEEVRTSDPAVLPPQVQAVVDAALSTLTTVASTLGGLAPAVAATIAGMAETERHRTRLEIDGIEAGAAAKVKEAMTAAEDERANTDLIRAEVSERESDIATLKEAKRLAAEAAGAVQERLEAEKSALAGELADERTRRTAETAAAKQAAEDAATEARRLHDEITDLSGKMATAMKAAEEARIETAGARSLAQAAEADAQRHRDQLAEMTGKMEAARTEADGKIETARQEVAKLTVRVAVAEKGEQAEATRATRAEAEIDRLRNEAAAVKAVVQPVQPAQPFVIPVDAPPAVPAARKPRSAA